MNLPPKDPRGSWPERCRARLLPAFEQLRQILARHVEAGPTPVPEPSAPAGVDTDDALALDLLADAFALSPFEVQVLLLCAGVEFDAEIAGLCATIHGDPRRRRASWGLALAALPGAHWAATAPTAPLRRWRLLQLAGEGLADADLRIDERTLHYLVGVTYLDTTIGALIRPAEATLPLAPSQRETAERAAAIIRGEAQRGRRPLLHFAGGERSDRLAIAAATCRALDLDLHVIRSGDVPADARARDELARTWAREAVLARSALLVEADGDGGSDEPGRQAALAAFLDDVGGLLLLSAAAAPALRARILVRVDVRPPPPTEQRERWLAALPTLSPAGADDIVGQFSLSPAAIDDIAASVRALADPSALAPAIWDAVRQRARPALGALARHIEPRASWALLVVPDNQRATLREIGVHVRQRQQVYERWGFAARSSRGLGISALFAGPSGTGKTMAAEVLAAELRLDLVHVDLSRIVSKYIGETEKNLGRIFDAADRGGAILLFDEADALFGRRSEVKDSHDRYANIEVSYLLQRMEAYRGLAILTTNLEGSLDPAFMRRIRFVVRFPFPEPRERAEIWRRIFPAQTPTADLDLERLARLDLPGGNIRNIALHAAFLAAEAGGPVTMGHVADAARNELRKLGRTPPERELRFWQ